MCVWNMEYGKNGLFEIYLQRLFITGYGQSIQSNLDAFTEQQKITS